MVVVKVRCGPPARTCVTANELRCPCQAHGLLIAARSRLRHHAICGTITPVTRTSGKGRVLVVVCASSFGTILIALCMTFLGIPPGLRPHVYWLLGSGQYKRAVLSSPHSPDQLLHTEWSGDGWGGAPVGDWMGYVVYDPSDSLPRTNKNEPSRRINGVPCDVVAVRRLEKSWYSVVTDMNQFWDSTHPNC